MCIIIVKQKGKCVSEDTIKTSARMNPHGLGVVWLDTYEITYHKSTEFKKLITDRPYIAHFRYATVGEIGRSNTHPFVCGRQDNEYLMMNGTIKGIGNAKDCDSKVLAKSLGELPRSRWKDELHKYMCRFVTVNAKDRSYQIYNKDLWTQKDGVWYSKSYVIEDNLVAVYGTLKKGCSNHTFYLSDSKFVGHGKTAERYPLVVDGLPYLLDRKGVGHNVSVDVFRVNDDVLNALDRLEGHPNWYCRKPVTVNVKGKQMTCWIYFNRREPREGEVYHKTYNAPPARKLDVGIDWFWDSQDVSLDKPKSEQGVPVCISCMHEVEHDAFQNYYCFECGDWYTENEILRY